jgi:hypothetical protein
LVLMDSKDRRSTSGWMFAAYHGMSTVPERFRSTSSPVPGQSVVLPEFSSTSAPATPAPEPTFYGPAFH